jgi:hypothetical protein
MRIPKIIYVIFAFLATNYAVGETNFNGKWLGQLVTAPDSEMTIEFTISKDDSGRYSVLMNSPDNASLKNLAADNVSVVNDNLTLNFKSLSGQFVGTVSGGDLVGQWKQLNDTFPLVLKPYQKFTITSENVKPVLGSWTGTIEVPGASVPVVFRFQYNDTDKFSGSFDSPKEKAFDLPISNIEFDGSRLRFALTFAKVLYSGKISKDGIRGTWSQGGRDIALDLTKGEHKPSENSKPSLTFTDGNSRDVAKYSGKFSEGLRSGMTVKITEIDGNIYMQPNGQGRMQLIHTEGEDFHLDNLPIKINFKASDEGSVDQFILMQNDQTKTFTRQSALKKAYKDNATKVRENGLSDAILMDDLDSAKALVKAGIDVSELDTRTSGSGRRPLNWAALKDNTAMIQLLLNAGTDINMTNRSGYTPLHHAAEAGSVDAAKLLINAGAKLDLQTKRGDTALDIATMKKHTAVAKAIEDKG